MRMAQCLKLHVKQQLSRLANLPTPMSKLAQAKEWREAKTMWPEGIDRVRGRGLVCQMRKQEDHKPSIRKPSCGAIGGRGIG
jgi:hypothetical protein